MIDDFQQNPDAKVLGIETTNEKNLPVYIKWGWKLHASFDFHDIKVFSLWLEK